MQVIRQHAMEHPFILHFCSLLLLLLPLYHSTITAAAITTTAPLLLPLKKVKVKFSQEQGTKSQTVNRGVALLFL